MKKMMEELKKEYLQKVVEIWKGCEYEGYPFHAENFDSQVEELRKGYPGLFQDKKPDLWDEELAAEIRSMDIWDNDLLAELCRRAGLDEEWAAADADSCEAVAFRAAEILGVEIR